MTSISQDRQLVTLINVFTVEPKNQQKVVEMLIEATERIMKHQPGFISANIHKSLDGAQVVNYAQWETKEAFDTMLKNPEAVEHMKPLYQLAKIEPPLYEVIESISV